MTKEAKKVSIQELQQMVREAVALQLSKNKKSAADRRAKMQDDKEKANVKENVKKLGVDQLRGMVKEAISHRLKEYVSLRESMGDMPQEGDLVSFAGKTGYVVQVSGDKVAVTRDGLKMHTVPLAAVQVLATADDMNELSPDELDSIGTEMGYNQNADPGEDPHKELERIESQLSGGNMLAGPTRQSLMRRRDELKAKLGLSDMEEALQPDPNDPNADPNHPHVRSEREKTMKQRQAAVAAGKAKGNALMPWQMGESNRPLAEEPYNRHDHGYLARMTWGQMPSDELWAKAMQDGWKWKLNQPDRMAFDVAMEMAGMDPYRAEAGMQTPEGMKMVVQALADCYSDDPDLEPTCERARDLASSVMEVLGFEWI